MRRLWWCLCFSLGLAACAAPTLERLPTLAPTITAPPSPTLATGGGTDATPTPLIGAGDGAATPTPHGTDAMLRGTDAMLRVSTPTPLIGLAPTPTPYAPLSPLAYVPAGEFLMGAASGSDPFAEQWERPAHRVRLSAFWIETTEVSNARYALCVAEGGCALPVKDGSRTRPNYYTNPQYNEYPMVNVTHTQAAAFCAWAGGRLPTEAEWEYVARFNDGRLYPWGNEQDLGRGQFGRPEGADTEQVGSFLTGASALGVLNLAGNVWEWMADWYDPDYYSASPEQDPRGPATGKERVVRGGAFATDPQFVRNTNRFALDPEKGYTNVGFRCVADRPPAGVVRLPTLTPTSP